MSEQLEHIKEYSVEKGGDDNIHFLDILTALAHQKKIVLVTPMVAVTLALAAVFIIKPTFSSKSVILPPQQQQSSGMAAMLGQLGGLAGAAGSIAGLKNPNDIYIGMLQSRTIADDLINKYDLKNRYEVDTVDDARKILNGISDIASDKTGTISISVEDKDPKFAAELANAFVSELSKLTQNLAITDASQRRLFFEIQLKAAKDDLANAEIALRKIQETTGMIQLDGQVKGIIASVAQLEATVAAREVQLNAMRSFATDNNPDYMRLQEEIRGLRIQVGKIKNGTSKDGDMVIPTGKIPEVGVEYIRGLRNLKYYETIFELLAKQYELAKIDEAKDTSNIQVLDMAIPAEKKIKPRKAIILIGALLGGGLLGILLALSRDAYLSSRRDKISDFRWKNFYAAWRGKSS